MWQFVSAATDTLITWEELLETVFSIGSARRLYREHELNIVGLFVRDKLILSSEKMLHKNYDHKGSVAKKISDREPQGDWSQDELTGSKPPVFK
jgi:hypothetical protein